MIINLSEIPTEYREQVDRFLTYYPKSGQQLAERYLTLVTSSEYRQTQEPTMRARPSSTPSSETVKPTKRDLNKTIILGEISLNPGQTALQIANRTGLSLASVRRFLVALERTQLIKGFSNGKAGYCLTKTQ